MGAPNDHYTFVGTIEDLKAKGRIVIRGRHSPILIVHDRGRVRALDNRCPHMGFPLDKGTIEDGILTCHWHHARFEVESGCTFDLWADDTPIFPVQVRNGEVYVNVDRTPVDAAAHWRERLESGLEHNVDLVLAKAILGQLAANAPLSDLLHQVILYGARNRDGWGVGLTIATALGNLLSTLPRHDVFLALFHGARHVAADCDGVAPHRERAPLGGRPDPAMLTRWLRQWTIGRHREAAERTLLTAITTGLPPALVAESLLATVTERPFSDTGHSLDFINKAFEALDLIGWDHARAVLPTIVGDMVLARGADESTSWRQPIDLVALCLEAEGQLADALMTAQSPQYGVDHASLAGELLGDDPQQMIQALTAAVRAGAGAPDLSRSLAYAAALRLARFGSANELSDWETAHHVFTYANAADRMIQRIGDASQDKRPAVRAVLHGSMALYLTRYLNVPAARIPGDPGEPLDDLPADEGAIRRALMEAFDRRDQVDVAARLVARHLAQGHSPQAPISTLVHLVLREDAGFHMYQSVEAGIRQFAAWGDVPEGRRILIGVTRYLAAHSPTRRATAQTARIVSRLMRGDDLQSAAAPADEEFGSLR